jgi:hypothetical protein
VVNTKNLEVPLIFGKGFKREIHPALAQKPVPVDRLGKNALCGNQTPVGAETTWFTETGKELLRAQKFTASGERP